MGHNISLLNNKLDCSCVGWGRLTISLRPLVGSFQKLIKLKSLTSLSHDFTIAIPFFIIKSEIFFSIDGFLNDFLSAFFPRTWKKKIISKTLETGLAVNIVYNEIQKVENYLYRKSINCLRGYIIAHFRFIPLPLSAN